ncbi:MAG: metalloprotease [Phycisphaeraceae bacterium]|nr:MAG: metalloprotease [Phycisphaeraceae bacterium]
MKWQGRRQSSNVEDRRGSRAPKVAVGGGMATLVIVVIVLLLGGNPQALLQGGPGGQGGPLGGGSLGGSGGTPAATSAEEDERAAFVSVVLADTEEVWHRLFAEQNLAYREPTLVLFRDRVQSACGVAGSATGPFYCPGDHKVYIDLSFFDELEARFDAPGDFAQAYVVAHEVGHHVQRLLGATDRVDAMRGRISEAEMNELSVRLELQADFYAGVWAHHAQRMFGSLEDGDLAEAFGAAAAVGDDRIQLRSRGHVVPESFTHGTSEQRMRWFRLGYEAGDMSRGDTFSVREP